MKKSYIFLMVLILVGSGFGQQFTLEQIIYILRIAEHKEEVDSYCKMLGLRLFTQADLKKIRAENEAKRKDKFGDAEAKKTSEKAKTEIEENKQTYSPFTADTIRPEKNEISEPSNLYIPEDYGWEEEYTPIRMTDHGYFHMLVRYNNVYGNYLFIQTSNAEMWHKIAEEIRRKKYKMVYHAEDDNSRYEIFKHKNYEFVLYWFKNNDDNYFLEVSGSE